MYDMTLGYIDHILSTADDWDFSEPGNYRLILRDIRLTAVYGVEWDVTMQLIAHDVHPWIRGTGDWLPDDSGTDERIGGFFLWNPQACGNDQVCKDEATSVMEIVNPEGEYPWVE